MSFKWLFLVVCTFFAVLLSSCSASIALTPIMGIFIPLPTYPTTILPTIIPPLTTIPTPVPEEFSSLFPKSFSEAAAAKCEKAFTSIVEPEQAVAPVYTLVNYLADPKSVWRHSKYNEQKSRLTEAQTEDEVQTLVCIQDEHDDIGVYINRKPALAPYWNVRLVRWKDGKVIGKQSFNGGRSPKIIIEQVNNIAYLTIRKFRDWLLNEFVENAYFVPIGPISTLTYSSNGKYLVAIGCDNFTKIYDTASNRVVFTRPGSPDFCSSFIPASFSPNGEYLFLNKSVLSTDTWKEISELDHAVNPMSVAFFSDGSKYAVGLKDANKDIKIYETASAAEVASFPLISPVHRVIVTPDNKYLIGAVYSCEECKIDSEEGIHIWDLESGTLVSRINETHIRDIALLPDGKTLAVAMNETYSINFFDVRTGSQIGTIEDSEKVNKLAVSPDGTRLSSVDFDNAVVFWDLKTLEDFESHEGQEPITALTFSPDGETMAVGTQEGVVNFWTLNKHNVQ